MLDTGSYTAQIASLENQNRQLAAQGRRPSERNTQLAEAESAVAIALSRYSDSHPDVSAARERLAIVQRMAAANPQFDDSQIIREQIAANNATIANLNQARNSAVARSEMAMAGSARAPVILEQAMQLENRASGLREQYRKVTTDLLRAQNSARMTTEQRGERLSLVEPPLLPDRPHSPNRPLLMAGGAVGGVMLGLILALLVELLARPVRSPAQIASLGLPVLGLVPTLSSTTRRPRSLLPWKRRKAIAG